MPQRSGSARANLWLVVPNDGRSRALCERLRDAGFTQDQTEEGRPLRQLWRITRLGSITVDFLIPPSRATDRGGEPRGLEE